MKKLFLCLLILFLLSQINSKMFYVENYEELKIDNEPEGIICFSVSKFEKDDNFFIEMISENKGAKINTTFYYRFIDTCDQRNNYNSSKSVMEVNKFNNKANLDTSSDGFYYEYEFVVDDGKHKGFLLLFRNFTGTTIKFNITPFSMITIFIFIGVGILIFIIIVVLIICCACKCAHRRKKEKMDSDLKSSFIQNNYNPVAPIIPNKIN